MDMNQLAQLLTQVAATAEVSATPHIVKTPEVSEGIKAKHTKAEAAGKEHANDIRAVFENLGFEAVDLAFQLNSMAKNFQFAYFKARQEIERVAAREAMPSRFAETEDMTERRARAVANADAALIGFYGAYKATDDVYKEVAASDKEAGEVLVNYLKPISVDEKAVSTFLAKQDADWARKRQESGKNARVAASTEYAATA